MTFWSVQKFQFQFQFQIIWKLRNEICFLNPFFHVWFWHYSVAVEPPSLKPRKYNQHSTRLDWKMYQQQLQWWRTMHAHCRALQPHDYSRKNIKNILMIGYAMVIWILIESRCASVLIHVIMVKHIHIWDWFFDFFSCYNKMQYRWRLESSIFNAHYWEYHDSLYIGLQDIISVLEEVYVVYLVKLGARVTNSDIHKAIAALVNYV